MMGACLNFHMFISIIRLFTGFLFSPYSLIAIAIALAIGFIFQAALFQILIRAKNETLTRWRASVLSLIGQMISTRPTDVYEIRPRRDKQGVDLISDSLPFGRLWYNEPDRLRQVFQPVTRRCDSRLRSSWQRRPNTRAHRRFQRVVNRLLAHAALVES